MLLSDTTNSSETLQPTQQLAHLLLKTFQYKGEKMSLRIRCPNCRRGMSGKHSLCKDCRGSSSSQTTVYVVESGARIEVTTDVPYRSSSSRCGEHSSSSRDAAYYGNGYAGVSGNYSAEPYNSYRDTRQGHESLRPGYVRPRVHPYSDRYEYISADAQPGFPPRGVMYPSSAQRVNTSSSYAGYSQPSSDRYQPQPSYAQTQQSRGQGSHVQYVYSGTEGPDGEIID